MRIERVLAPNSGPYTGSGTNTYLVGDETGLMVIDPGPDDRSHLATLIGRLEGERVDGVVATHTHSDHAPLANPLAAALGTPVIGFAPGPGFFPDRLVSDGDVLLAGETTLEVIHTPGHSDDHICLRAGSVIFTGDHVMGGSSVMVEDMSSYLASLERLLGLQPARLYPGHGEPIDDPVEVLTWYIAHRRQREREILEAVQNGCRSVDEIVEMVYHDVDPTLHLLAARSVVAHLRKLAADGAVRFGGDHGDPVEDVS